MGAQAKKKGPVKGGKGGRKANKQSGETAPSWALEQLALEQDAADVEDESPEAEALAALLAQGCRDDVELATLALARAARLTMQSSKRHPELVRLRNGRRRHSEPVWIPRRLEWALPGALTRDTSYPHLPRPALVRGGLAAACVAAMSAHLQTRAVQQDGCAALGGAALGAAEGRVSVCAAGVPQRAQTPEYQRPRLADPRPACYAHV